MIEWMKKIRREYFPTTKESVDALIQKIKDGSIQTESIKDGGRYILKLSISNFRSHAEMQEFVTRAEKELPPHIYNPKPEGMPNEVITEGLFKRLVKANIHEEEDILDEHIKDTDSMPIPNRDKSFKAFREENNSPRTLDAYKLFLRKWEGMFDIPDRPIPPTAKELWKNIDPVGVYEKYIEREKEWIELYHQHSTKLSKNGITTMDLKLDKHLQPKTSIQEHTSRLMPELRNRLNVIETMMKEEEKYIFYRLDTGRAFDPSKEYYLLYCDPWDATRYSYDVADNKLRHIKEYRSESIGIDTWENVAAREKDCLVNTIAILESNIK